MKFTEVFDIVYIVDVSDIRYDKSLPERFRNRFSNYHASRVGDLFFQSNDGSGIHPIFEDFSFNSAVFFYSPKSLRSVRNAIYPIWPHINFELKLEPIDSRLFEGVILAQHEELSRKNKPAKTKNPRLKNVSKEPTPSSPPVEYDFASAPTDEEIDFNAPDDVVEVAAVQKAPSQPVTKKKKKNNRRKKKVNRSPPDIVTKGTHVDIEDPPPHSSVAEKSTLEVKKETPEPSSPLPTVDDTVRKTHPDFESHKVEPDPKVLLSKEDEAKKKKLAEDKVASLVSSLMF
jgi:hypothetical protein